MRPGAALLLVALLVPAAAAGGDGLSFAQRSSLPAWVSAAEAGEIGRRYAACACLNPFYQRGDFDGDGQADYAVLATERAPGKRGILVVLGAIARSTCSAPGASPARGARTSRGWTPGAFTTAAPSRAARRGARPRCSSATPYSSRRASRRARSSGGTVEAIAGTSRATGSTSGGATPLPPTPPGSPRG